MPILNARFLTAFGVVLVSLCRLAEANVKPYFDDDGSGFLREELLAQVRDEERAGRPHGQGNLLAQASEEGKCNAWTDAMLPRIEKMVSPSGSYVSFFNVVSDVAGPGGLHNYYVGLITEKNTVSVFIYDPWYKSPGKQFHILKPITPGYQGRAKVPRTKHVTYQYNTHPDIDMRFAYDPVRRTLVWVTPPNLDVDPRTFIDTEIGDRTDVRDAHGLKLEAARPRHHRVAVNASCQGVPAFADVAKLHRTVRALPGMATRKLGAF